MNELIAREILKAIQENNRLLRCLVRLYERQHNRVTGGVMTRIGDSMGTPVTTPIIPGTSAKFVVTPEFSGDPFATQASEAAASSSDATNFPATIDSSDSTGLTIDVNVPVGAVVESGIVLTWTYTNLDGHVATVTGTYDVVSGTVSDVTGGTFTRVA